MTGADTGFWRRRERKAEDKTPRLKMKTRKTPTGKVIKEKSQKKRRGKKRPTKRDVNS